MILTALSSSVIALLAAVLVIRNDGGDKHPDVASCLYSWDGGTSGGQSDLAYSPFWDSDGPYPYTFLYENWSGEADRSPAQLYADAEAVFIGRVETAIRNDGSSIASSNLTQEEYEEAADDQSFAVPGNTLFRVEPLRWIKGTLDEVGRENVPVVIRDNGERTSSGQYIGLMQGNFILEPGRTYLLFLRHDEHWLSDYSQLDPSRGTFDLTTGTVKVFSHSRNADLEIYDGLTLHDFFAEALGHPCGTLPQTGGRADA